MKDKKLYRSSSDRLLGGVCAGIAEYFEIDPTVVRLVFIILVFALGLSIWVYPLLWIIIPEQSGSSSLKEKVKDVVEGEVAE